MAFCHHLDAILQTLSQYSSKTSLDRDKVIEPISSSMMLGKHDLTQNPEHNQKQSLFYHVLYKIFSGEHLTYILKSGGISFVFKLLGIVLGFLVIYIVSNRYNQQFYGTFALMQVIIQSIVIVFTFGLQNILVIEINKRVNDNNYAIQLLKKICLKIVSIGIIPSLVLVLSSGFISDGLFLKPNLNIGFKIMGASLIFFLLYEVILNFFIAQKTFLKYGLFMFVMPNVFFITYLLLFKRFVLNNENHVFMVYASAFVSALILALLSVNWRLVTTKIMLPDFTAMLRDSTPIMLSTFTLFLFNWVAVIILGRYSNEALLGIYNTAFKLGSSVQLIMLTINIIIAPKIADLYHNNQKEKLKTFIHQSTRFIGLLTLPLALVLILLRKPLLGLFGSEFVYHGSTVLIIVTVATFINSVSGNVDHILNMTNNQKSFFKVILWALAVNVVVNLILIPRHGIIGAAIACLLSTLFMNVYALVVIKKKLGYYTLF